MEDKKQPIVVKKIVQGHGHHGGSWKVAFADFATAMMAFFMVLWLVGQTDANKRGGIAEYFQNPSMVRGHSEAPTGSIGPGGAGMSLISFGTSIEMKKQDIEIMEKVRDGGAEYRDYNKVLEQKRLENLLDELREEIGSNEALKPFKDQLLLEIMSNGLRIQIVDKENRPMFDAGSANLKYYTEEILNQLASSINRVPNKISISGHTDITPMAKQNGRYTNWELSADRANSARRALEAGGLKSGKIARVIGLGSTVLYDTEDPTSPINRRITIVVMKRAVSDMARQQEAIQGKPAQLLQGTTSLENVKDPTSLPASNDGLGLELQSRTRTNQVIDEISGDAMEMDLRGYIEQEKQKQNDQSTSQTDIKRPTINNEEIVIRDPGSAKSFIKLPPIIDPNLVPPKNKIDKLQ